MFRKAMLGDTATLNLDFTTGVLDSRLTFTRAAGTATYINSSGYVATATTNEPRFDYSPTNIGEPKGLLVEGTAINLTNYSEDFSNAAWTKSGIAQTPASGTSPDNSNTATLIAENAGGFIKHSLERSVTVTAGSVYTWSVFLKQASSNSRRYACVQVADGQAVAARNTVVFDLQTGTVTANGVNNGTAGAPTDVAHSITSYRDGWYRVSVTMKYVSSPCYPTVILSDISTLYGGSNQPFYTATVPYKGLLVYGAQLELGSGASSYIPTGASQVTRNADECTATGSNFSSWWPLSQSAFTVYWDGDISRSPANTQFYWLTRAGGSSRSRGYVTTGSLIRANNTAYDFTMSPTTSMTVGTRFRSAVAISSGSSAMYANNSTVTGSDTSAGAVTLFDADSLNFNPNAENFMHIRAFKFYQSRLTNAELLALVS